MTPATLASLNKKELETQTTNMIGQQKIMIYGVINQYNQRSLGARHTEMLLKQANTVMSEMHVLCTTNGLCMYAIIKCTLG